MYITNSFWYLISIVNNSTSSYSKSKFMDFMYVRMYVCMYGSMYVCMYVGMQVCMYVMGGKRIVKTTQLISCVVLTILLPPIS